MKIFFSKIILFNILFWLCSGGVVHADEKFQLTKDQLLPFIEGLIKNGELDQAEGLLHQVKGQTADPIQEKFLLGQIAYQKKEYKKSIALFRSILDENPKLTRVRLDLARAFFMVEDDGNAKHHFELALSDHLPNIVLQKVQGFLYQVKKRKKWSFTAHFAIAPDTNISASTDDEYVTIFGNPNYILSDDARKTSGLGVTGSFGLDYFWKLGDLVKLKTGVVASHTNYKQSQFNDTYLAGHIGPRFVFEKHAVTFQATAFRRWFGGSLSRIFKDFTDKAYNKSYGIEIIGDHILTANWRAATRFSWVSSKHDEFLERDGNIFSSFVQLNRSFTSSSFGQAMFGITREGAVEKTYRNTSWRFGLGYYQDFGAGISFYIKPEYVMRHYDAVAIIYEATTLGDPRKDHRYSIFTHLKKRDFEILGFVPTFSYTFTSNVSNISFYSYNRHRFELGLTRVF